ncbi:TetR family transcriptional regulator [Actinoallomurus sp. NPDC052274]|uniref:TetR/AcrR family transcriptional regulator n=1 Tax=Actinoallomurus sp. NPDC052274 TaxID=3155420 RepID=UPI0034211F04
MGNREDLLSGAKRCLIERGWAHTTVRDIAAAAGVSHAAIGYHFGSKDALLTQALVEAVDELGDELARSATSDEPEERWQMLIDSFTTHRALWVAQLEAAVHATRSPEVRRHLAEGQRQGREGLGGSVPLALLTGLMLQWLVDPDHAPSGADVIAELRSLAAKA